MTLHPLFAASFGMIMAAGCAHAPGERAALKDTRPQMAVVTGSRLPQRVDAASGVPATFSSVRIYGRQQLADTGRQYDTGTALRVLDPSLSLDLQPIKK